MRTSVALLAVIALCAVAGVALPGRAAPPVVEIVPKAYPVDSTSPKGVAITCPAGKRLIGGGFDGAVAGGGIAPVAVNVNFRVVSGGATPGPVWAASAQETEPFAGGWRLAVQAVCVGAPSLDGLQVVQVEGPATSASPKLATAACPAGKSAIGGGFAVLPPDRRVAVLTSGKAGAAGWIAYARETEAFAGSWKLVVQAVCVS